MKAAVIYENGGPDVVRVEDIPEPVPAANEVVVEVHSAALNHLDIWVRKGRPGQKLSPPHVLGSDAAGIIVSKGSAVHGIETGEEVILNPGLSCGCCQFCRSGEQSLCATFGIVGLSRAGTFAERVVVPAENVQPKPSHLNFIEAAAMGLSHLTAWRMLMTRAALKPGETVLIHGIGGGVALACLQIAKSLGATAIVTSSSDEKLAKAKDIGADFAINYRTNPNVAAAVKDFNGGKGVDVIADTVGAATLPVDFDCVRRGGRIVLCGVTSGAMCQANLQALYWNQLNLLGSTMGSNEDFRQMVRAVEAVKLKPVINSVEPLENVKKAISKMENSEQFGKIVLMCKT